MLHPSLPLAPALPAGNVGWLLPSRTHAAAGANVQLCRRQPQIFQVLTPRAMFLSSHIFLTFPASNKNQSGFRFIL